ncbi:DNA mismatch repair endonuclease MutL [Peptoniphilus sp. EMRHCC_23]|uniref:DNA mismatch repair endonuclease MutL n=1 Tax=Peptoniphilus rachelemmaiella TaxID=2811779 RepID=UPI001C002F88|nr:DNA mismatch repair endonuclease MutL [Peptoniphilus rachelemmaiella]
MREIYALSDQTISQIAAGEIIENPASIIKELVENAIDANADRISIRLSDNLLDEIRIADNGDGIEKSQITKAFSRHATSKLRTISDLDMITSLGFRGEALASIAHISQMECVTKTANSDFAYRFTVEKGVVSRGEPVGAPVGTTMIVRDIFYNTPVRKKFLNTTTKEIRRIVEVVELLALSHQDVSIHLSRNQKTLLHSKVSDDKINHIYSILGKDIAKNLLPISFDTESYKIEGFIGNNLLHRATPDREFLFVNGRGVKSNDIARAIRKVYRSLIPLNHYPVYVLYITIDPILIDVNIHPQKQTIRLSNENQLTTILQRLVEEKLLPKREIPSIDALNENTKEGEAQVPEKTIFELSRERKIEREKPKTPTFDFSDLAPLAAEDRRTYGDKTEPLLPEPFADTSAINVDMAPEKARPLDVSLYQFLAVVFKTYVLFENKRDHRVLMVDQHAAHERILYERYSKQIRDRAVATQLLLAPLTIHLSPEEMHAVNTHIADYEQLGIFPEVFGEQDIVIREVPEHLLIDDFRQFFLDSIHLLDEGVNVKEQNIYKIMRLACRSAIKAGDRISEEEAYALLEELNDADTPFTCPHGRPTMIHVEKRAFEKLFLREGL